MRSALIAVASLAVFRGIFFLPVAIFGSFTGWLWILADIALGLSGAYISERPHALTFMRLGLAWSATACCLTFARVGFPQSTVQIATALIPMSLLVFFALALFVTNTNNTQDEVI
jgi:hypothetical protein